MKAERILVPRSLQETLWRLEEARLGFRDTSATHTKEALQWVLKRQGLPGSYRDMFAPTQQDISKGIRLPTGELMGGYAGARHVIGEEALRTLAVWKFGWHSTPFKKAMEGYNGIFRRVIERNDGLYCCYKCTVGFLRSSSVLRNAHLAWVRPDEMDDVLRMSLNRVKKARTGDGKWRGFPYYYMLLALSAMDMPPAKDELRYASMFAERLIRRNRGDDRGARFRRLGLEAALNAAYRTGSQYNMRGSY